MLPNRNDKPVLNTFVKIIKYNSRPLCKILNKEKKKLSFIKNYTVSKFIFTRVLFFVVNVLIL